MQTREEKAQLAADMVNAAIRTLSDALEQGQSDAMRRHLMALARFHRYSVANMLLIVTQMPEARLVAGYHAWKRLGRQVKRGEKGILIRAPYTVRVETGDANEPEKRFTGFKPAYVFDVSQTDGKPLPELNVATVSGEPKGLSLALQAFAGVHRIEVRYVDDLSVLGASSGGLVKLRAGLTPAEEFSTLVHEIAHELMHYGRGHAPELTVRETEAEAVAFVVSHAVGLEATQAAADYIQLYRGDAKTLMASLERVRAVSGQLITFLHDYQMRKAA